MSYFDTEKIVTGIVKYSFEREPFACQRFQVDVDGPVVALVMLKNPFLSHDGFRGGSPSLTHPNLAAVNPAALMNSVPSISSAFPNSVPAKVPAGVLPKLEAYSLRVLCNLQR